MVTAIITCAGSGNRAGFSKNKLLENYGLQTVIDKTISKFLISDIDKIILTSSQQDFKQFEQIAKSYNKDVKVVLGGKTRANSVYNALKVCDSDIVLIHDGARPFVTEKIILDCIQSVKDFGSGITSIPSTDTIGFCENDFIVKTERANALSIQTPQGFLTKDILLAYEKAKDILDKYTDDSGIYCDFIGKAHCCSGDISNKKLTYKQDFDNGILVGTGFDLHTLVDGRDLILGGIKIPHTKGLLGHSDADVLTHAIMDAILSSLSLGDIGKIFSDKDPQYKDISSLILLEKVLALVDEQGYKVRNVTAVIMAQKPKLSTFTDEISTNLAKVMHIEKKLVGITCTTLEGVGLVGREQAIACQSYCSVERK